MATLRATQSAPRGTLVRCAAPQTGYVGIRPQSHHRYWSGGVSVPAPGRFEHIVARARLLGCLRLSGTSAVLPATRRHFARGYTHSWSEWLAYSAYQFRRRCEETKSSLQRVDAGSPRRFECRSTEDLWRLRQWKID